MAERGWTVYDSEGQPRVYVVPDPVPPSVTEAVVTDVVESLKCVGIFLVALVAVFMLLFIVLL